VRKIRRIVAESSPIDFELCIPPFVDPIDDDAELGAIGLYPRGVIVLYISQLTTLTEK
jgi:hypothetical protein